MKIGVFDSGLGGERVLEAIRRVMPEYDYVYYGDTKNLPYGDKTEEEIYELTRNGVIELFSRGALLVIVACNTASAESLRMLQENILSGAYADRRILGVIIPTIEVVLEKELESVMLIGTRRTIESGKYDRELRKRDMHHVTLRSIATPELVPLIESGRTHEAFTFIEKLVTPRVGEVEGLILGCTHYTVLTKRLRERFKEIDVLSQDEIVPKKLQSYLGRHPEIEEQLTRSGTYVRIITGHEPGYRKC